MEQIYSNYHFLTDDALCSIAAAGDRMAEEVLVVRHNRLVRICCRPLFLVGGDSEDLLQEGMVGLLKAIREYDSNMEASFPTYAEVCIRNRLFSAIKAAQRYKHAPLNDSVPLESPFFERNPDYLLHPISHFAQTNPEDLIISREELRERMDALSGQLSDFEANILSLYLSGLSYSEMGTQIGKSTKSVDNAVQRIRRKLAQHFSSGDFSKS